MYKTMGNVDIFGMVYRGVLDTKSRCGVSRIGDTCACTYVRVILLEVLSGTHGERTEFLVGCIAGLKAELNEIKPNLC